MLRIELLGHFHLIDGERPITRLTRPRLRTLLVYLLLNRQRWLPRQRVAFFFWPDTKDGQAHSNLRNLLTKLHRAIPELTPFLQIDEHGIGWRNDLPCSLDVADFEAALQRAERASQQHNLSALLAALEEAVELYTGELLPDLYEDWVLAARQRLQNDFFYALEWLIQLRKTRQEYGAAIRYAQLYVEREPLSEVAYRHLIELYALNSDHASAARTYQRCRAVLWRDLEIDPSPATQALYGRILSATPGVTPGNAGHGLERLLVAWADFAARGAKPFPGVLAFLTVLAQALAKHSRVEEALHLLDQGCSYLATPSEAAWEAELHRLRGRLLQQQGAPPAVVRPHYQRALEVAQNHQAHFFALRAAADLCALEEAPSDTLYQRVASACRHLAPDLRPEAAADLWAAIAEFQ